MDETDLTGGILRGATIIVVLTWYLPFLVDYLLTPVQEISFCIDYTLVILYTNCFGRFSRCWSEKVKQGGWFVSSPGHVAIRRQT